MILDTGASGTLISQRMATARASEAGAYHQSGDRLR
ncbi:hypothetical protein QUA72_24215 [Microcoleus sp. M2_B4]